MAMILDFGPVAEMIRVTAEYSNAVLVAVLPYISDCAQKLDLPVPHPTTAADVEKFTVIPIKDLGCSAMLKGGWGFNLSIGRFKCIDCIQGPRSYMMLQDPDEAPRFYGEVRMSADEAVKLARDTLRKLDIPLETVFAEQQPRVTGPLKIDANTVPYYRIEWLDPRVGEPPPGQPPYTSVEVEVDGRAKRVERLYFNLSCALELRPPLPKISVVPEPAPGMPPLPRTNPEYAWRLIPIALRAVDEYGETLGLPIPRPLTTNHLARFSLADNGGWPHAEIELTNGWRFIYRNNMVNGYYSPDNLFSSGQRRILIKDFVGRWNLNEAQAAELIRRTVATLNYPTNRVHMDFKPTVHKPAVPGIPRYSFWWWYESEDHQSILSKVEAEVDADKGELKSLYCDDVAYWNHPPPIGVPISLPGTNVSAVPREQRKRPTLRAPSPPGLFKLPGNEHDIHHYTNSVPN